MNLSILHKKKLHRRDEEGFLDIFDKKLMKTYARAENFDLPEIEGLISKIKN